MFAVYFIQKYGNSLLKCPSKFLIVIRLTEILMWELNFLDKWICVPFAILESVLFNPWNELKSLRDHLQSKIPLSTHNRLLLITVNQMIFDINLILLRLLYIKSMLLVIHFCILAAQKVWPRDMEISIVQGKEIVRNQASVW